LQFTIISLARFPAPTPCGILRPDSTSPPDLSGNSNTGIPVDPVTTGRGKVGNALVSIATNNKDGAVSGGCVAMPPAKKTGFCAPESQGLRLACQLLMAQTGATAAAR